MKSFVINLKRRKDRKEDVVKKFNLVNFTDYDFYNAIDGKKLEESEEIYELFLGNDFDWRKGVIGCALSHYNLWKKLYNDLNTKLYCIFEDDFEIKNNFKDSLEKCKNFMLNNDVDILFLGYTMFKNNESLYSNIYNCEKEIEFFTYDSNLYIGGFFGYMISKNGSEKMLSFIKENGIKHGIDYLIKKNTNLIAYEVRPFIVRSQWVDSLKSSVDSDIQKDFDRLNFFDKTWDFYKNLDSYGCDLKYIGKKEKNDLLRIAENTTGSVGVNTLGFIKSYIKYPLVSSQYFGKEDGIFIKRDYEKKTRIKLICNWETSEKLCQEWNKMTKGDYFWNNLQFTWEDIDIDYYVIINMPYQGVFYKPEKTIIFQLEPRCNDSNQKWGTKTWGEWANPQGFLHVVTPEKTLIPAYWLCSGTYKFLKENSFNSKADIISHISSSKYFDPGHKFRIDFIHFLEKKGDIPIKIFGRENYHNFQNYSGKVPDSQKEIGIYPFKYYFMCENNSEKNYITEKLWEPILYESLCFYWGCPNVSDWISSDAFVQLDMNDFEKSYQLVKDAMSNNLWEKRILSIRKEKQKILNYHNIFPTIERILSQ